MGNWEECEVLERDAKILSGAWVFCGTRVPVAALFENLKDGASVNQFLACFPGVKQSQVESVLEHEMIAATDSLPS